MFPLTRHHENGWSKLRPMVAHHPSGWSIAYHGARLADIYTPTGKCVDCVQARPWDHMLDPHRQKPYIVTKARLLWLLEQHLAS